MFRLRGGEQDGDPAQAGLRSVVGGGRAGGVLVDEFERGVGGDGEAEGFSVLTKRGPGGVGGSPALATAPQYHDPHTVTASLVPSLVVPNTRLTTTSSARSMSY